jgi:aspartate carbamoyltransferase regulatory subunit
VQSGEKLLVEKIEKGVVIDHITPCKGFLVYNIFNPDPDSTAVIAKKRPLKKIRPQRSCQDRGRIHNLYISQHNRLNSPYSHDKHNLRLEGQVKGES